MKNKNMVLLILILILVTTKAHGENNDFNILDEQINALNIESLGKTLEDIIGENEIGTKLNIREIFLDLIRGDLKLNLKDIPKLMGRLVFVELNQSLGLLAKILTITLISSILTNLQGTFESSSVSELANYISYVLIAILVIASFSQAMELAKTTIDKMVNFMQIILPILLTLLTATGGPNTRILFQPMILVTVNIIGIIIKTIILPLIFFSFIISILSNISKRMEFSKLAELIRQVITFIITGSLTLFIGIITIYGLGSKVDGLTIRTAKFAIDKFIPIVGGFLSDAVDAVIGCSGILKNGLGFIGLLTLLLICILPIIKLVVLLFVYKLITVVIQPVGSKNLVEFFNQVGKSLLLLLVSLISTATMFFITITIIVETGNNLLMLR